MASAVQLGKYRLIAELGHGGMADVFLAMVEGPIGAGFTRLAIVKRLRQHLAEDPEFVAMLVDEGRITARLNHPNVVQMLEVGVEGEEYFLAMEYLDGQPLHRVQRRFSRGGGAGLALDMEIVVLLDTLAGLHHAHELTDFDGSPLNIVHRDVTPHNIFVTYDGSTKVVDFGIAKAAGRMGETKHGIVKGKVRYMSPEQVTGGAVDRRSDVFAVGIILWQACTQKKFWGTEDDFAIVQTLINGDYDPSPRAIDPSVPEELDRICCRALAHRPEDRYASAAELRADLEAFIDVRQVKARHALAQMIREAFVKERANVRAIIEDVGRATATMSMQVLTTTGTNPSAALASGSTEIITVQPTTIQPTTILPPRQPPGLEPIFRPISPMNEIPSIAPIASPIPASGEVAVSRQPEALPARRPWIAYLAVAASILFALAGFGAHLESSRRAAAAPAARAKATVEPSFVTLARTPVRQREGRAAPTPSIVYISVVRTVAAPQPQAPSLRGVSPDPSSTAPSPTPSPALSLQQRPQQRGRIAVDNADPWGASSGTRH